MSTHENKRRTIRCDDDLWAEILLAAVQTGSTGSRSAYLLELHRKNWERVQKRNARKGKKSK